MAETMAALPIQRSVPGPVLDDVAAVLAFCQDLCRAAAPAHAAAPFRLARRVAGAVFDIASTIPEQAALCETRLGEPAAAAPAGAARLLVACARDLGLAVPVMGRGLATVQALEEALDPTPFRLHHHPESGFWQVWDRDRKIGVQLQAAPDLLPAWEAGSPLRNLVKWALTTRDCGLLHAGTLAVGGRGLLFVGQGGSGKSGTVLAGLCAGMDSVGDDYVFARIGAAGLEVMPVFNTLKCDPAGLRRLGLADRADLAGGPTNWQGKHEFTFAELAGAHPAAGFRIAGLCLPAITHAERTCFVPVPSRDAFLALAPTGVAQLPCDRAAHFTLCARITRMVPCYRLNLGTDPAEIAAAIRAALVGELPRC